MSGVSLPPDAPAVRLCHVVKWEHYDGYGFNLHTEKSKSGQFLGKIDQGSPAEAAQLKEGDRIVEVNGVNVANENHKQVVERIKAVPSETKLLVVDPLADNWYKEHKIIIKNSLPSVVQCKTPKPVLKRTSHSELSPRLCHLVKRPDFDGYGFNLNADKVRNTQYVGSVDKDSPAERAGLQVNDTIIEVNGVNVEGLNHKEIVEKIKAVPHETKLLVVDEATARWMRENNPPAANGRLAATVATAAKPAKAKQSSTSVESPYALRLCHLRKWPNYEGYGFNLHANNKREGHFVGQVNSNSPAQLGGLLRNDRVVQVNGLNVEKDTHKQITERICQNRDSVDLLVVDPETEEYFTKENIPLLSANVVQKHTPEESPLQTGPQASFTDDMF
ncbi:Na(+)/H(+) exchange regulatory cofactor NHE-RF2-like isoform X2 [Ornithodoros turicata]|uniref:Na(+)/H(+) exchange regulatory cofactor NHE-RF2-like isoform X2 n=1 Tax=Ornithodoros turicata TaxID=34597 RepID=UPI003138D54F